MINAQLQAEDRILNPPTGVTAQAAAASANARTADGKAFLGVAPMDLPFGLGVSLARVDPNTPAQAAGLQEGDMVFSYNGQAITSADEFRNLILRTTPGSRVPIEIRRGTNKMTLSIQM
jgi:S1-C subfamily serine protease